MADVKDLEIGDAADGILTSVWTNSDASHFFGSVTVGDKKVRGIIGSVEDYDAETLADKIGTTVEAEYRGTYTDDNDNERPSWALRGI